MTLALVLVCIWHWRQRSLGHSRRLWIILFLDRGGIDNQLAQNAPFSGFQVFNYEDGFRFTLSGQGVFNPPTRDANGNIININGNPALNNSTSATGTLPTGSVAGINLSNPENIDVLAILPENKTANVQQFNVQFQQQLTNSTALSVAYVGTRGRNLALYYNLNGRIVDPGTAIPCPRSVTARFALFPKIK